MALNFQDRRKVVDLELTFILSPSQWLRHPSEPAPPDPVLRRHPFPRLPPHELRGELRVHLHLVGQAAEHRQPVQQVHAETGGEEGAVNHSDSVHRRKEAHKLLLFSLSKTHTHTHTHTH